MNTNTLAGLRALQHADGGFASVVASRDGSSTDLNGFVTAIVLRLLRHLPHSDEWTAISQRALDWVSRCRSPHVAGAYAFWPEDTRPTWAQRVPADVDDTAIMLTELLRHGRLDRAAVLRSVCKVIIPCRVASAAEAAVLPPWVTPGSFFTWIVPATPAGAARKPSANIVDCCVNTNVVALMSRLEARHLPGYEAALQTVANGLEWAGRAPLRLTSLTPFYPSPLSLVEAMEHAVECGADAMREPLQRLLSIAPDAQDEIEGVCRSAYGSTTWHAPAIGLARAISQLPSG